MGLSKIKKINTTGFSRIYFQGCNYQVLLNCHVMMAANNVVSVAVDVGSNNELFKFNKNTSLDSITKILCEKNGIDYVPGKFAFQYIRNQSCKTLATKYVTEDNKDNIVNGTELKLVFSPTELSQMIFDNLQNNGDLCWALEKLAGHVNDPVFVSNVFSPCYPVITEKVNSENIPSKLFSFCLKAILGFLRFDFIHEVDSSLIKKLIKNIESTSQLEDGVIVNSLKVLEQSVAKNQYNLIATSIDIEDILPLLRDRDSPLVQESALTLINNIAYYCPCEEMKPRFLRTMNSYSFLSTISSNILYTGAELSTDIAEQLHIYQSLILELILDRLDPFLLDCCSLPDFVLVSKSKRFSNFESNTSDSTTDIHSESTGSSRNSTEASFCNHTDRLSSGSKSGRMYSKRNNLVLSFINLNISEFNSETYLEEMPNIKMVNQLVSDCIMFFSKNYRKNYQVSLCTEGCQNFITISFDVVNLLINDVLHVGRGPVKGSTLYYPLVFSATEKQPFLEELFCVAMWLYVRTKREMKATNYDDYTKVLKVMKHQLREGMSIQPKTYLELEKILRRFTYASVSDQWQIERKAKQQQFFETSSAVKELKCNLQEQITELIKIQRINYIIKGSEFPVWNPHRHQKIKKSSMFARLSSNKMFIIYSTNVDKGTEELTCELRHLAVRDIKEFVVGKKSPHLKDFKNCGKDKKKTPWGFSLIIDRDREESLDFMADNREIYDYWVDALNALFGKVMGSNSFKNELSALLKMDLQVHLLDVEGIDCPNNPPPIPPPPDNYDFVCE